MQGAQVGGCWWAVGEWIQWVAMGVGGVVPSQRPLHHAGVTDRETTVNPESAVSDAFGQGEGTGLGRAVGRVEDSAVLVDGDSVSDSFSVEARIDAAIEPVTGWRRVRIHLVHSKSEQI